MICDYMATTPANWSTTSGAASSPPMTPIVDPMNHSLAPFAPAGELNHTELELMVQWCTDTYRSVAHQPSVEWIWHAAVPREALQQPFLLHGILAVSALHLSFRTNGDTQAHYLRTAHTHRQHAHGGLSQALRALGDSNCNAAFAVTSMLTVFSFALPLAGRSIPTAIHSTLDELCHIMRHTQQSMNSVCEIIHWVGRGELHALVECDETAPRMPDTSRLAIMALARTNETLALQSPRHDKCVFDRALDALGHSLDQLARGGELLVSAFRWIVQVPPRFIELVCERHPFALVILAHYAVVLHLLRERWWVGDWGARVIQAVGRSVDWEWRKALGWVLDATGCTLPQ
ncbi:hypothetical protein BJX96DRAFT_55718 [Aspergillus floccosus]